jgi:hypothetical protein
MQRKRPSSAIKKQRHWYSWKKKRLTLKMQLVVDQAMGTILCLAHAAGWWHDFRVLKESGVRLHLETEAMTDPGNQGLQKRHGKTTMPKKRSKKNPLTMEDKRHNCTISKARVPAEHIFVAVKRFGLRFTLIAAAYNKNLTP